VLIAADIARAADPVLLAEAAGIVCDDWQSALLREMPKRALLNCSRQSGKSTTCALMALHVLVYEPGSLTVVTAPSARQSAELLRTVRMLHGKLGDSAPALDRDNVFSIEAANGSRILAVPGGDEGKNIRGLAHARLLLVDEAARVSDGLIGALRPMLATNRDGALVMLSTSAGRRGKFFEYWTNDDPTWTRVRVAASDCPRISAEWLERERRELGESRFQEEYQLTFLDSSAAAFSSELIACMFSSEVRPLWI
jgi:hypothetical protein